MTESSSPLFSPAQIKELISKAQQLGFTDDVAYFKAELAKLDGEE